MASAHDRDVTAKKKSPQYRFWTIGGIILGLPAASISYVFYKNGVTLQPYQIAILGFTSMLIVCGLIIFRQVFHGVFMLANLINKAEGAESGLTSIKKDTSELHKISLSFKSLMKKFEETTEELRLRVSELFTIKELTEIASRSLDIEFLLNVILEKAMFVTRSKIGSVFSVESEKDRFRVVASRGLAPGPEKDSVINFNESLVQYVVSDKKPLLVKDIQADPRTQKENDAKYGPPSFLSMPIFARESVIGVVNLSHKETEKIFDANDEHIVSIMTGEIGFALENAMLHLKVEDHSKELEKRTVELTNANEELQREIRARKLLEEALAESRERYRHLVETVNDVIWEVDATGVCTYVSPRIRDILGYEPEEVLGKPFLGLVPPGEAALWASSVLNDKLDLPTAFECIEVKATHKDGHDIILEMSGKPIFSADGTLIGYLGVNRDITNRKKIEQGLEQTTRELEMTNAHLEHLVRIDSLTELLNRRGMEECLTTEVDRARREGAPLAAILLDCDNFKNINNTMGHAVGDIVLKELGKTLAESLRSSDRIARIGGDEYLILLPDTRMAEALSVSEKLRIAVSTRPLPVASKPISITASFGVSKVPPEVSSIEEILSLTRLPLQRSKSKGKNIVSIAQKDSNIKTLPTSQDIIERLLQGDCLYAASQPIFHLTDERVVGYELISRSTIENFEMPVEFLGLALEKDILTHVDLQCLRTCIAGTALLKPKVRFHVNLFPSTMLSTPIESLLKLFPRGRQRWEFCVEISEQQFIGDPAYFKEYITALKEAGILIALDDLGFGRSSLESLVVLEPDLVKIDRVYVNGIAKDKGKRMSFQRMLEIFKSVETQQIAEGIETKEDLNILKEMGVAYGQGYLWGKPSRIQNPDHKKHEAVFKAADTKKMGAAPGASEIKSGLTGIKGKYRKL